MGRLNSFRALRAILGFASTNFLKVVTAIRIVSQLGTTVMNPVRAAVAALPSSSSRVMIASPIMFWG